MTIKTLKINIKHNDMFAIELKDEGGKIIFSKDDYAPNIPHFCGGDYTDFFIDNETGKIIGWVPLTDKFIENNTKD
jgi:hypothetical protein